ncbi:uncharacterized protein LOC119985500 [Tripterygium wilfordii]|uniref:uncharacterized protein LOC119985500 n=1 Tax=Tripterygium wilfordii TaxID=458696 RepID=UPI0018F80F9C|nr:uncharacterized protein LOC119985500 [Tripterygium wilfordii]
MARRRIRLAWIENRAARKATLKKRRPSLLKKVSELAILYYDTAAIIVKKIDQGKKMLIQESYLREEVVKLEKKVTMIERKLKELELKNLMNQTDQDRKLGGSICQKKMPAI